MFIVINTFRGRIINYIINFEGHSYSIETDIEESTSIEILMFEPKQDS